MLYSEVPVIQLVPVADRVMPEGVYHCPIYKVLSRRGVLSTTGHSTNFVSYIQMPTAIDPDDWIRAGVAGVLALKF